MDSIFSNLKQGNLTELSFKGQEYRFLNSQETVLNFFVNRPTANNNWPSNLKSLENSITKDWLDKLGISKVLKNDNIYAEKTSRNNIKFQEVLKGHLKSIEVKFQESTSHSENCKSPYSLGK
jgi:hypothetical protein